MHRGWIVASALVVALSASSIARASFTDADTASANYSTGSLAAPTNPGTSAGTCTVLASDRIVVTWTATASTWADGYEIARSTTSGGPYSVVGSVAGHGTTSYDDGPLAFSTTYYYVVRATKNSWRSPDTAQVSRTTRTSLCL